MHTVTLDRCTVLRSNELKCNSEQTQWVLRETVSHLTGAPRLAARIIKLTARSGGLLLESTCVPQDHAYRERPKQFHSAMLSNIALAMRALPMSSLSTNKTCKWNLLQSTCIATEGLDFNNPVSLPASFSPVLCYMAVPHNTAQRVCDCITLSNPTLACYQSARGTCGYGMSLVCSEFFSCLP